MCGIVAVVSAYNNGFTFKEMNLFNNMLFVDTLRGWDSTGVFSGSKYNNLIIHKAALSGPSFMRTEEYTSFEKRVQQYGMFAVGHNRAATRGAVEDKNSHPFWVDDNIVLVQNGTWNGDHKKVKDLDVDTEVIAHLLNDEEDIEKALQKVNSAYALSWYDVRKKQLNFIRNSQRPLWKAVMNSGAIVFASEESTIKWAADKENMVFKTEPEILTPSVLHSYIMKESGNHEEGVSLLDNTFRYQITEKSQNHHARWNQKRYTPAWAIEDREEDGYGCYPVGPVSEKPETHINKPSSNSEIDIVFSNLVREELGEFHFPVEMAKTVGKIIQEKENSRVLVSLEDYRPANKHKDCQRFYVYGRLCDVQDVEKTPCALFYWTVAADEETVLNMVVNKNMYTVQPCSPNVLSFLNNDNNRMATVMVYCLKPEEIAFSDEEIKTEINSALH